MAQFPLSPHVPIVDKEGRPTPEFLRWTQTQRDVNEDIVPLNLPGEVSAVLDVLSDVQGSVLYRGAANWQALAPGTAGRFLQTAGAGADPAWASAAATFLGLTDTPSSYSGEAGNVVAVKGDESGLEFIAPGGGGGALTWNSVTVTNGDFETGTSTGWTTDIGSIRIEQWASMTDYGTAGMTAPVNGTYFYNGGESGFGGAQANVSSYQDIDVSSLGAVAAFLQAKAYKNFADTDYAEISMTFYDGSSNSLGSTSVRSHTGTGAITTYRMNLGSFLPPGTETIRVRLTCTRLSGTNNNSGIDNVELFALY